MILNVGGRGIYATNNTNCEDTMTYTSPALQLVGAAQNLVLGGTPAGKYLDNPVDPLISRENAA